MGHHQAYKNHCLDTKISIRHKISSVKSRAQALLFSLFVLFVIGALAVVLAYVLRRGIQTHRNHRDGSIAFYLAQAGLERAKAAVAQAPPPANDWYPCGDDTNPACWYQDLSSGWYKFNIVGAGNIRTVSSKGRVIGLSGEPLAERQLQVIVNRAIKAQISWSWTEQ